MDRDEHSYKRYKQYRRNKYRYEQEQITFPIAVILALALFVFQILVHCDSHSSSYPSIYHVPKSEEKEREEINRNGIYQ